MNARVWRACAQQLMQQQAVPHLLLPFMNAAIKGHLAMVGRLSPKSKKPCGAMTFQLLQIAQSCTHQIMTCSQHASHVIGNSRKTNAPQATHAHVDRRHAPTLFRIVPVVDRMAAESAQQHFAHHRLCQHVLSQVGRSFHATCWKRMCGESYHTQLTSC